MDPVAHTLAGAGLARTGLHRTTPLATATLLVAANAPDLDILASAGGPYASLAFRRGWTHGPLAMVLLPFLVAGGVLAWDRWVRRRRNPSLPKARGGMLLLLSFLGVASHPILDWLNTYGIRLLMPFDGRWFYGDAVFIVDPWLWLMLAGGVFLSGPRTTAWRWGWGGLALLLSLPVLLLPQVPLAARLLWVAGVAGVVFLHWKGASGPAAAPARVACAASALYILLMVGASVAGSRIGEAAAVHRGIQDVREVLYSPLPANPLAARLVVATPEGYLTGSLHWLREPRANLDGALLPSGDWEHPSVREAMDAQEVRDYLVWVRFPYVVHEVREGGGSRVFIGDARYPPVDGAGGLQGVEVQLPGGP